MKKKKTNLFNAGRACAVSIIVINNTTFWEVVLGESSPKSFFYFFISLKPVKNPLFAHCTLFLYNSNTSQKVKNKIFVQSSLRVDESESFNYQVDTEYRILVTF